MTIRITVNNDGALPGSVVGVRQMTSVGDDTIMGGAWFLAPGKAQTFYLHDHQYLVVVELKRGSPGNDAAELLPPAPVTPEPTPQDVLA